MIPPGEIKSPHSEISRRLTCQFLIGFQINYHNRIRCPRMCKLWNTQLRMKFGISHYWIRISKDHWRSRSSHRSHNISIWGKRQIYCTNLHVEFSIICWNFKWGVINSFLSPIWNCQCVPCSIFTIVIYSLAFFVEMTQDLVHKVQISWNKKYSFLWPLWYWWSYIFEVQLNQKPR